MCPRKRSHFIVSRYVFLQVSIMILHRFDWIIIVHYFKMEPIVCRNRVQYSQLYIEKGSFFANEYKWKKENSENVLRVCLSK